MKLSPTRCSRLEDPIVDVDHAPMKSLVTDADVNDTRQRATSHASLLVVRDDIRTRTVDGGQGRDDLSSIIPSETPV